MSDGLNKADTNVKHKPIDLLRNSGGVMQVGTDEDGPIAALIPAEKHLYCVKSHAIYAVQLADQIDPERENPDIPHTQQKELSVGSQNPDVARTLLTAHSLLKKTAMGASFNVLRGIELIFEVLRDITSMRERTKRLEAEIQKTVVPEHGLTGPRTSLILPSIEGIDSQFEALAQKSGHVVKGLGTLAKLFYPQITSKWIDALIDVLKHEHEGASHFWRYIESAKPLLLFVNDDLRNLIEHPKPDSFLRIHNFRLLPSGKLEGPTVEIVRSDRRVESYPITEMMTSVTDELVNVCEGTLACLCDSNLKGPFVVPLQVIELTPNQREHPHVRFSYGYYDGEKMVPTGVG